MEHYKMSHIKDIIKTLSTEDLNMLRYSLENDLSAYIYYCNNRIIGVNLEYNSSIVIETVEGHWSIGSIKEKSYASQSS